MTYLDILNDLFRLKNLLSYLRKNVTSQLDP